MIIRQPTHSNTRSMFAFSQGDQPWLENSHYWDDFFLLKVNYKYLLEEIERTFVEKPAILKVKIFSSVRIDKQSFLCDFSLLATIEHHFRSMFTICRFNPSYSPTE